MTFMMTIAVLTTFNANNPIVAANGDNKLHCSSLLSQQVPLHPISAHRMFSKSERNLLKHKADDDNAQHLAPPRKKMALTVLYTGLSDTDILTHQSSLKCKTVFEEDFGTKHIHFDSGTSHPASTSDNECPFRSLPLKLILMICKVFQELVGPCYLKLIGLEASESGWIRVNDNNCNGLLLWKHLKNFVPPKVFWFSSAASMADKSF
ncbi:hypothetical protein V8B97DRAFT_1920980 [Scleroderma yunnanense]